MKARRIVRYATAWLLSTAILGLTGTMGLAAPSSVSSPALSKFEKASPVQALANRILATEMADQTRRTIVPTLHLVETEHFLIYSAWNPSNDATLSSLCEQMFQKLAQQFKIPAAESVWAGKCPIYLFWEPGHYARFISEVDQSVKLDPNMSHARGYHADRGEFAYVVINGVAAFGPNQTGVLPRSGS